MVMQDGNENDGMTMKEHMSYRTTGGVGVCRRYEGRFPPTIAPLLQKPELQKLRLSCRLTPS